MSAGRKLLSLSLSLFFIGNGLRPPFVPHHNVKRAELSKNMCASGGNTRKETGHIFHTIFYGSHEALYGQNEKKIS
jgi:hypothetical protein